MDWINEDGTKCNPQPTEEELKAIGLGVESKIVHIDEWLDTPTFDDAEIYAKFVLDWCRCPAWKKIAYAKFMSKYKLFCTYKDGKIYRVTGASRMGDVWLAKDRDREHGYDLRVVIADCSNWKSVA